MKDMAKLLKSGRYADEIMTGKKEKVRDART
jgi:hypothetical protein